jgi:hypothetical protein
MSTLDSHTLPYSSPSTFPTTAGAAELLREVPRLLEYRAEVDPDAEFIPKTIAGFATGFLVMSTCLAMVLTLLMTPSITAAGFVSTLLPLMAFVFGIDCVASSLLLVALKVRADHTGEALFARHWLNSLSTGAGYAVMICGPWLLTQKGIPINRFVAAAIWMSLMALPALAAAWTVRGRKLETRNSKHET